MGSKNVVVVGAGVSGLTTALLLAKNKQYAVTVAAKYMPGDYDIEFASPWAGANYLPVSQKGSAAAEHDKNTWPELERLARDHPECGIHFQEYEQYNTRRDIENLSSKSTKPIPELFKEEPWFRDTVPNFRTLNPSQMPAGFDHGIAFTSVCINTSIYLPYLVSQCLAVGVIFKRAIFSHISEAATVHGSGKPADVVVNCTGLAAGKLGGVEDKEMVPARGQTVLVRNDPGKMLGTSELAGEEMSYIMQRAAGGGTILGGCYQVGNWDSQFDPNLANRIMKRALDICPALTNGKGIEEFSVVRHNVGLRPLRLSGVRLEKEKIGDVWTVHNYGHGGFGYQSSYGCAMEVVRLVEELFAG